MLQTYNLAGTVIYYDSDKKVIARYPSKSNLLLKGADNSLYFGMTSNSDVDKIFCKIFSVSNINEAELKRKVISRAKKVIMLLDNSKIGKDLLFTLADISDIHVLITDSPLPDDIQKLADDFGITVI